MEYSKNQKTVFREITDTNNNIIISAVAGSGKTTTIVESIKFIPKEKRILFLAFNNSIVKELEERLPKHVYVSTLHSFGFKSCIRHFGSIKVSEGKIYNIADQLSKRQKWFKTKEEKEKSGEYLYQMKIWCDLIRMNMDTTPKEILETLKKHSHFLDGNDLLRLVNVIKLSNKVFSTFDFADMIYQPALRNIRLPKFDYVYIDEIQDLNRAQQNLVKKLIKPSTGRLIGVGDPAQSIYFFAGADNESYERMKNLLPKTVELPLSISYRCAKNIIKHAQEVNGMIQYWENSKDGIVRSGSWKEIEHGDWVLCRNLKPLIILFLMLLKDNKKAIIKGKDIGENLIRLIKKSTGKKIVSLERMKEKLDHEINNLRLKLIRKGVKKPNYHQSMVNLVERVEVIKILSEGLETNKEVADKIKNIFTENPKKEIVLSTIHKSKGLENDKIFSLCPELIPSKFAVTEHELIQEKNLDYVMRTRAISELIYINDF